MLRAIAKGPQPSLKNRFDKIIHVDCSRWKSRRALQRAIADELRLPQRVKDIFDRQDEDDDFSGVDEGSRDEIEAVGAEVYQSLHEHRWLVIFHNGSDYTVNLHDFGIPPLTSRWSAFGGKVLWTFRGRLRLYEKLSENVDKSHFYMSAWFQYNGSLLQLLREEAREITSYTNKPGITLDIATDCCLYLLLLSSNGGDIMDYNWATHASNYWVCDGIIGGGQPEEQAWEDGAALHQEIWLDGYSSSNFSHRFCESLKATASERWVLVTDKLAGHEKMKNVPTDQSTSVFLADIASVPIDMFLHASKLRVLKICRCSFSFSTPPFYCCHSLRFLGIDSCQNNEAHVGGEGEKQDKAMMMDFFRSLWVLDINHTDWTLPPNVVDEMATNVREVNIRNGRIWGYNNLTWGRMRNIRKLRVIEPISSWETGQKDEFTGMVKLELLDLTGNNTIQVLPSLSGARVLKTLVLDGCVGLEHVVSDGHLPPSLESFSFDAGSNRDCKLSRISLAGCVHLENFKLRGTFPRLEELDLSRTSIRRLDLSHRVVQLQGLGRVFLMGCKHLRAILWWKDIRKQLKVLCIDTHGDDNRGPSSLRPCNHLHRNDGGYVVIGDARLIQSLIKDYTMITESFYLIMHNPACSSSSKAKGQSSSSNNNAEIQELCYYDQVSVGPAMNLLLEGVASHDDISWPPPSDCHLEIGEGFSLADVESRSAIKDFHRVLFFCTKSLHVHDNSSITQVNPYPYVRGYDIYLNSGRLKWCRIERCPKLRAVFFTDHKKPGARYYFKSLRTILAAHLLTAICIWSKGIVKSYNLSFKRLQSIHVYSCPRLKFVLPLSEDVGLPSLEIIQVVCCGEIRHIFPLDDEDSSSSNSKKKKVKVFPELKHILLHDLFSLEQISEYEMLAPALETVKIRGCWSLRRLPAVGEEFHPIVDCEKDWWEKLEWDGLDAGHHPSLFKPRHPAYYKKKLPRVSVLR